jgi:iron-sulfur cluster assembly accessory protein
MVTVTKTQVSSLPTMDSLGLDHQNHDDEEHSSKKITKNGTTPSYIVQSDALIVTPSCLSRVETLIEQRRRQRESSGEDDGDGEDYFLRVFVDAGGCSGFQYRFEIDHEFDEDDDVVVVAASAGGAGPSQRRVVVDETSLGFLHGSTLDYVIEMIKSSFVVRDNPQSESACGCGSSFAVKNFSANPATD